MELKSRGKLKRFRHGNQQSPIRLDLRLPPKAKPSAGKTSAFCWWWSSKASRRGRDIHANGPAGSRSARASWLHVIQDRCGRESEIRRPLSFRKTAFFPLQIERRQRERTPRTPQARRASWPVPEPRGLEKQPQSPARWWTSSARAAQQTPRTNWVFRSIYDGQQMISVHAIIPTIANQNHWLRSWHW